MKHKTSTNIASADKHAHVNRSMIEALHIDHQTDDVDEGFMNDRGSGNVQKKVADSQLRTVALVHHRFHCKLPAEQI